MSWVGDLLKAGIDAKGSSIQVNKPFVEAKRPTSMNLSASDNGDGTATVTFQAANDAGTVVEDRVLAYMWAADTEFGAVSAMTTSIAATTGTIINELTASGEATVLSDGTGTIVMTLDNGTTAATKWVMVAFNDIVQSLEVTITTA